MSDAIATRGLSGDGAAYGTRGLETSTDTGLVTYAESATITLLGSDATAVTDTTVQAESGTITVTGSDATAITGAAPVATSALAASRAINRLAEQFK